MTATVEDYSQAHSNMIDRYSQSHQSQLSKLESMNEAFNKNLNAVLTTTKDKLIAQVKADTDIVFQANYDTMLSIIKTMEITSNGFNDNAKLFSQKLNDDFKKSKGILDNRVKRYNSSMEQLFELDDKQKFFFWVGIVGSISTPMVSFIILLFHIFG